MPESTLSITRTSLQQEVGLFLGYGTSSWDADQTTAIGLCIDSGLRNFYYPPPIMGERSSHTWSFLTPTKNLQLVASVADYDLPDDFGGLRGDVYFVGEDTSLCPMERANMQYILLRRQNDADDYTAQPVKCAMDTIATTGERPTRYTLAVWPTPDQEYRIRFSYLSNPMQLTSDAPYPLGGQPHAETLIESCLASAEAKFYQSQSVHKQLFIERLTASVMHDRKATGARTFGYNGDGPRDPYDARTQVPYTRINGAIPA